MTVTMTTPHDDETFDMALVHDVLVIPSPKNFFRRIDTVGVTRCGLLFDLAQYGYRFEVARVRGQLVTALENGTVPTCMQCITETP